MNTTKLARWAMIALVVFAGCIPSLNPVCTDEQTVFDPSVLGQWVQEDSQNRWEIGQGDGNSYRLLYTDEEGRQSRFVAHVVDLNGTRFLDLFPETADYGATGFYQIHVVPIHTIYLVKGSAQKLRLAAIDYKWLDEFLTAHPNAIQFATFDGRKMITASTKDLQTFVVENKAMFTGDFNLVRARDNLN